MNAGPPWLAAAPGKRATERFVLAYTPLWIAVVATLVVTRVFTRWGDVGHLALGLGAALPLWIAPLFVNGEQALGERHAARYVAFVTVTSLFQCYFGSWLFFDRLGMEYHFPVHWIVNRTPLFLYLLTIAYFGTYYVLLGVAWRAVRRRFPSRMAAIVSLLVLGYAMAFCETFSMANDLLRDTFRYRDHSFALLWGSIGYGTCFVFTLPVAHAIGETRDAPPPTWRRLLADTLAANALVLVAYEVFGALATPR